MPCIKSPIKYLQKSHIKYVHRSSIACDINNSSLDMDVEFL